MEILNTKCPNCGANLELNASATYMFCQYCGTKIIIKEILETLNGKDNNAIKIQNLLARANQCIETHEYEAANDYYDQVINLDANNYEAWWGKFEISDLIDQIIIIDGKSVNITKILTKYNLLSPAKFKVFGNSNKLSAIKELLNTLSGSIDIKGAKEIIEKYTGVKPIKNKLYAKRAIEYAPESIASEYKKNL